MKTSKAPIILILTILAFFSCQKETSVEQGLNNGGNPGGGGGPAGALGWSFTGPNNTNYGGCVDTAYYESFANIETLTIDAFDTANNALYFSLISLTGNITAGTYSAPQSATLTVITAAGDSYTSSAAGSFSIQLTTVNDTLVVGTFTASLSDPFGGGTYVISNGKIRALIGKHNTCGTTTGGGGGGGGGGGTGAVFSLVGAPATCSAPIIEGDYFKSMTLGSAHKVTLDVSVSTAGNWNVSTNTINGFKFSGSGTFPNTGMQSITLEATGTPVATGNTSFPVSTGTSNCSFIIPVDSLGAPCSPANNSVDFSVAGIGPVSFYGNSTTASGGSYKIVSNGIGGDLTLEFAGTSQPAPGIYDIQPISGSFTTGDVRVSIVASNIYWQSNTGSVYVTVSNGKIIATFCDVSFSGTLGGPTYTTLASAKVTQE
jgi:hypothetical protein